MEQVAVPMRVLVVDDNADAAYLIAEVLTFRGHFAEIAIGGPEGLSAAMTMMPDVVVLDLGMPVLDGYQVAAALRKNDGTSKVRLIALTAWGDSASRARVLEVGFDVHLVKPAPFDAIFHAVEAQR